MSTVTLDWAAYPPPEFLGGAVTVGNFDGVHLGHRALVAAARAQADRLGGPTVAVTFDPPPHQLLYPGPIRPPLTTLPERAALLNAAKADHVVILRTSPALLALSPEAFFEDVLVRQLGAKAVVEGPDFRFGRNRAGSNDTLRKLCAAVGIAFEEVPQLTYRGEPVSSSRVRAAILQGDVEFATELLARPYRITGTVVTGAKRGRTIGFPTANLGDVPTVLPGNGVYAVHAMVDEQKYPAAANIGPNPTFGEEAQKIEVHLIGFSGDLYGKSLTVEFIARLRDTRPFAGVAELVEQLNQDVAAAAFALTPQPPLPGGEGE
jgi:riboflavin kinase / FMN adenylyltransferase